MRLKKWYKIWSNIYKINETELIYKIDEIISLNTKVFKKSYNEWYFFVNKELYEVRLQKNNNKYIVTFVQTEISGEETSDITDKNVPFKVMDGIAVILKKLIEEENPLEIKFSVYNNIKKANMFKKIVINVIKKHNIFSNYKLITGKADNLLYKLPNDMNIEGIKFTLKRSK